MNKIDFKKELKGFYSAPTRNIEVIDVPVMNFLMVDGEGNPNTAEAYRDAIEALYTVSYTIKFAIKKGQMAIDYAVMPLEGLWWADDMSAFSTGNKDAWKWTAMIMQPEFVKRELVGQTIGDERRESGR